MKTWTETPTLAALAVLCTLPLAGCTEGGPGSVIEAELETFDTETVYEIVPVGGSPSLPGEEGDLLQFDSEEAKRGFARGVAPHVYLEPLSAERTAQVWSDKRMVMLLSATAKGCCRLIHVYNPPTLREVRERQRRMYGPDRPRREEVPR